MAQALSDHTGCPVLAFNGRSSYAYINHEGGKEVQSSKFSWKCWKDAPRELFSRLKSLNFSIEKKKFIPRGSDSEDKNTN